MMKDLFTHETNKKTNVLINGLGWELEVIYICPDTSHFLARKRLSPSKSINPLEYNKNGKHVGFSRSMDIVSKKKI